MEQPKQLETVDLQKLRKICQEYIDFVGSDEYHNDNDYNHYIYEAAMETLFGKQVWEFINSKNK